MSINAFKEAHKNEKRGTGVSAIVKKCPGSHLSFNENHKSNLQMTWGNAVYNRVYSETVA